MPYSFSTEEQLVVVRWDQPTVEDVDKLVERIEALHAKTGKMIDYLAVLPATSKPPEDAIRRAMMSGMDSMSKSCRAMHLVVEGTGLKAAMVRGVLTGIMLGSGRNYLKIFSDVDAAAEAFPGRVSGIMLRRLLEAATTKG